MRRLLFAAALSFSAATLATAAQADTANNYNLVVLNEMKGLNSSVQGRVAVGGNATETNYSVGAGATAGQPNLVVGGNLTSQSLNLNGGQTVVGGTVSNLWGSPNIQPSGTPIPINFGTEAIRLKDLSTNLATYADTGTTQYVMPGWAQTGQHQGQITLTGLLDGLNVFTIDASKLSDASTFNISLKAGSTALINVTGANGKYYQTNFNLTGGSASSLLWNFSQATNLSIYDTGAGFQGSILAPLATYNPGGWGAINGQVIVNNFYSTNGSTTINNVAYAGNLLAPVARVGNGVQAAIPEPATWAMMIVGFGAAGVLLRRRRAVAA